MKDIVIFGTGGHAKVVSDIIAKQKLYNLKAFVSLNSSLSEFMGLPHHNQNQLNKLDFNLGIVAIGDNFIRKQVVELILSIKPDFSFVTAIHPSAQVGVECAIAPGAVVMANAVINPGTKIGQHCIINTGALVDHDVTVEDFASIAPGCTLGGNVKVGSFSAISLGASIIHGINIGEHAVVGAGSVVVKNIDAYSLSYGNPCKLVRQRKAGEKYL